MEKLTKPLEIRTRDPFVLSPQACHSGCATILGIPRQDFPMQ